MDENESTRESPTQEQQCPMETDEPKGIDNRNPTDASSPPTNCLIAPKDSKNIVSGMSGEEHNEHEHQNLHQQQQQHHQDYNGSTCNSNGCQFTGHHYHYIEYPGMYYQQKIDPANSAGLSPSIDSSGNYHYCVCSCSSGDRMQISATQRLHQHQHQQPNQHQQRPQQQSKPQHESLAVAAIVHHHQSIDVDSGLRSKSEQSLLSHSYQMLNLPTENKNDSCCNSKLHINCDLDGNRPSSPCSCTASVEHQHQQQQQHQQSQQRPNNRCKKLNDTLADSMLATDEITVSESDNNGSLTKRKNMREARVQKKINSWYAKNYNCNHIEIYSDGDEADNNHHHNDTITVHGSLTNILDQRPPLPPRPQAITSARNTNSTFSAHRPGSQSIKKYVIWCLVCGGFSCLLGALFLGVYFLLHSYTITVGNFETVPTFVPATLLILTGLCVMSLARRRNRYSYLIKLSGACGLISALTCALVTVTTTVLHMSRLQALRECEYAQKTRTCTCYSDMIESQVDRVDKEGVRLVFDSLSDCGVVHGSLYSCLRAIFGLSVAGVLVAVFSCMLVYQLLSHERKKMYWEQLELRCRSLYTSHQQQHQHQQQGPTAHSMVALAGIGARSAPICRCCEQCHAHRQMQLQTASYPWVDDAGEPRFWAGQPPGNFYSPNPGGDDNNLHAGPTGHNNRSRISSGWSWPRMPWQRSSTESGNRFRQIPSSPDSQYGFSSTNPSLGLALSNVAVSGAATGAEEDVNTVTQRAAQAYNIVPGGGALPYGIWGPPPPYSDPNSPARRGYYQYIQPPNNVQICPAANRSEDNTGINSNDDGLQQRPLSASALNALAVGSTPNVVNSCVSTARVFDHITQRLGATDQMNNVYKSKENTVGAPPLNTNYGNTGSDSDGGSACNRFDDRFSNTLPTRKTKKRVVDGSNSITKCIGTSSRHQLNSHRINVQRIFPNSSNSTIENDADINSHMHAITNLRYSKSTNNGNQIKDIKSNGYSTEDANTNQILQKIISGHAVEDNAVCLSNCDGIDIVNGAVNPSNSDTPYEDPTGSEIYFADVSSCCNMSMKNDSCYGDPSRSTHQRQLSSPRNNAPKHIKKNYQTQHTQNQLQHQHQHPHQHHHQHAQHQQHQRSNCSQNSNGCCASKDDHLIQQNFGQRETSIRNRNQNFVQARQGDGYVKKLNTSAPIASSNEMNGDIIKEHNQIVSEKFDKIENSIPKDSSLHSMCSNDSEAKTECTDLSPMTPSSNKILAETIFQSGNTNINTNTIINTNANAAPQTPNGSGSGFSNFIASFPYSSDMKFHEAHRRYAKHIHDNLITASTTQDGQETHYEVIHDEGIGKAINKTLSSMHHQPSSAATSSQPQPQPQQQQQPHQRPKNLHPNCNYGKNSINRTIHTRCPKAKENMDAVWSSSDTASSSSHNRQRL